MSLSVDQTVKSLLHLNTKETLFLWSSNSAQATEEANFRSIPRSVDCLAVKHVRRCENQTIILMNSVFIRLSISTPDGTNWDVTHLDQELESCKSAKVFNCEIHQLWLCEAFSRAVQWLSRKLEVDRLILAETPYTHTWTNAMFV